MTIGAVIIGKNEAVMIAECLESLKGVDAIYYTDTGSTDDTVDIVRKYTDNITHFKWCDDFSKARNFAIQQAKTDFLLIIDCDEVLRTEMSKIRDIIDTDLEVLDVKVFSGNNSHYQPRLFKRKKEHYYLGLAHEYLSVRGQERVDVEIEYKHSPAHKQDPDRYIRILTKSLKENPNSVREKFYLGREYQYKNNHKEAVKWLDKYLIDGQWLPERAEAYYLKAYSLWHLQRGDEARESCANAIIINANMKKALQLMAEMSWPNNAIRWNEFAKLATNEGVLFSN